MTTPATNTNIIPTIRVETPPLENTVQGNSGVYSIRPEGIFYSAYSKFGELLPEKRVCSPLRVLAKTRSENNSDWGCYLEWQDNDGRTHRWAMPMEMLAGEGLDVIRELLKQGLKIEVGSARKVLEYIQSCETTNRVICTDRVGWHRSSYVTQERVYGEGASEYIYQSNSYAELTTGRSGTLEDWQDNVAAYAVGNSRLGLSISAAFAGSLVKPAGIDSGGFHIHGDSSTGKSTAQLMAASVWGMPKKFKRSWRSTSNGLEGIASLHNDNVLILDEIREINGKDASETAYMLGNGQGKTRANRTGAARVAKSWSTLFLSSGEVTLSELLQSEGKSIHAGQEVRIANVPADAGQNMGIIENSHGFDTPSGLADHLRYETNRYYGEAGTAWLQYITQYHRQLCENLPALISRFCDDVVSVNATGQVHRVAKRFALVGVAGELATQAGITGWNDGESTDAAMRCFNDWLTEFGGENGENREHLKILETVKAYIERNGSKFANIGRREDAMPVPDLVGYYRNSTSGKEYLVLASQFDRVIEGLSSKTAKRVMVEAGWLGSTVSQNTRLPMLGQKKIYVIRFPDEEIIGETENFLD